MPKNGERSAALLFKVLPVCPRVFYLAKTDQHSDLTVCDANRDTVMAVAADSHRDFLIPEQTVLQYARQPPLKADDLRLFFCRGNYSIKGQKSQPIKEIFMKKYLQSRRFVIH
jgi:hypothetical protein